MTGIIYNAYSSNKKTLNHLEEALEMQLRELDIKGETVLIKPNMVDPSIPKSCSTVNSIQTVANALLKHGASEILVGDEPASYYIHNISPSTRGHFNVFADYHDLGYSDINHINLIDLKTLPNSNVNASRINPATAQAENISFPVKDTSELMLVSLSLPKDHGQYSYSGVSKNLMGLVPESSRQNAFHYIFPEAAADAFIAEKVTPSSNDIKTKSTQMLIDFISNYCKGLNSHEERQLKCLNQEVATQHLDPISLEVYAEHIVNAGAITGLVDHVKDTNPNALYVLDGSHFLKGHEHDGELVQTDFAIVGQDPTLVDFIAAGYKLGIKNVNGEVPYLNRLIDRDCGIGKHSRAANIEQRGYLGNPLQKHSTVYKELFNDSHNLPMVRTQTPP